MPGSTPLTPAAELAKKNTMRYPNESAEYRQARQALLVEEIELRRHIERVAHPTSCRSGPSWIRCRRAVGPIGIRNSATECGYIVICPVSVRGNFRNSSMQLCLPWNRPRLIRI